MRFIKLLIIGVMFSLLAGCANTFAPRLTETEASLVAKVQYMSGRQIVCEQPDIRFLTAHDMKNTVDYLVVFAEDIPGNQESVNMYRLLQQLTDSFFDSMSNPQASRVFCIGKIDIIYNESRLINRAIRERKY